MRLPPSVRNGDQTATGPRAAESAVMKDCRCVCRMEAARASCQKSNAPFLRAGGARTFAATRRRRPDWFAQALPGFRCEPRRSQSPQPFARAGVTGGTLRSLFQGAVRWRPRQGPAQGLLRNPTSAHRRNALTLSSLFCPRLVPIKLKSERTRAKIYLLEINLKPESSSRPGRMEPSNRDVAVFFASRAWLLAERLPYRFGRVSYRFAYS